MRRDLPGTVLPMSGRAMEPLRSLTPKGERTASRILQAATTLLSREGFGGASLGRVAEEAGVHKRNVLYYFGTREALLVRVVQTVGERIAENIASAIVPAARSDQMADAVVEAMWAGVTSEPQLARAYFALVGGGAESPEVDDALRALKATYLALIARQLERIEAAGFICKEDHESVALLILALLRGLLLEWTEESESVALNASLGQFKALLSAQFAAP
jgi:AcrR family transcriptional regulator